MKVKKLELLKTGASLVVSVGVGAIVGNVVKHTTPSDVKKITKVCIGVGSLVLTNLAGDMAAKYMEDKIDAAANAVKGMVEVEIENSDEVEVIIEEA